LSKYFGFWLSKSFSKRSLTVYFVMETWFFCSYKVNWELLLCMYLNCWNRVVSYNFDVVNLFIRWFWHLVEWKFFKIESQCILHSVTINFLFLRSCLEILSCMWNELLKWSGFLLCFAKPKYESILALGWLELFQIQSHCIFQNGTMILLFIQTYLGITFMCVDVNELLK